MKKIFYTLVVAAIAMSLNACTSNNSQWTKEQRKSMRRALQEYRDMVYVDELSDAEFFIFSDEVIDQMEITYPNYDIFYNTPNMDESVDMVVTTYIVEQLDADGSNIRHIYPYRELRRDNRLPRGLSGKEQRSFYKCLARKINSEYKDFGAFFNAVIANTTNTSQIAKFEAECAKQLFDWSASDAMSATEKKR